MYLPNYVEPSHDVRPPIWMKRAHRHITLLNWRDSVENYTRPKVRKLQGPPKTTVYVNHSVFWSLSAHLAGQRPFTFRFFLVYGWLCALKYRNDKRLIHIVINIDWGAQINYMMVGAGGGSCACAGLTTSCSRDNIWIISIIRIREMNLQIRSSV